MSFSGYFYVVNGKFNATKIDLIFTNSEKYNTPSLVALREGKYGQMYRSWYGVDMKCPQEGSCVEDFISAGGTIFGVAKNFRR